MTHEFNSDEAKKHLLEKERLEKENKENERKALLSKVIAVLKDEFKDSSIEVFLVGSILKQNQFSNRSDVDIVVKNYNGDRFNLWTRLESKIERDVEIILFETCPFKEFVLKEGLRVI